MKSTHYFTAITVAMLFFIAVTAPQAQAQTGTCYDPILKSNVSYTQAQCQTAGLQWTSGSATTPTGNSTGTCYDPILKSNISYTQAQCQTAGLQWTSGSATTPTNSTGNYTPLAPLPGTSVGACDPTKTNP